MAPAAMLLYAYMGSALAITLMSLILWCWLRERLYILCAALLAAGFAYAAFRYRPEGLWLPGADQPQHALSIAYCSFCVVATVFSANCSSSAAIGSGLRTSSAWWPG